MSVRPWETSQSGKKLVVKFSRNLTKNNVQLIFEKHDLCGWAIRVPHNWEVECLLDNEPVSLERARDEKSAVFSVPWQSLRIGDILEDCLR
jgi:hypothetical protein